MEKGMSFATKIINDSLSEEIQNEILHLINETPTYNYKLPTYNRVDDLLNSLSDAELLSLKSYTGYNFKRINAILRNNWNYEEHGKITEQLQEKYRNDIEKIDSAISKAPANKNAFITYQGTTIASFKAYGITNLEDLKRLKNSFIYEQGYTSTSILEEQSYYNKEINGKKINIEIKYIIPPNTRDGILLNNSALSYSPNQQEYLIGRGSLSKVIDVKVEKDTAVLTAILIPKYIWNISPKKKGNTK